jgi:hypothetical protein
VLKGPRLLLLQSVSRKKRTCSDLGRSSVQSCSGACEPMINKAETSPLSGGGVCCRLRCVMPSMRWYATTTTQHTDIFKVGTPQVGRILYHSPSRRETRGLSSVLLVLVPGARALARSTEHPDEGLAPTRFPVGSGPSTRHHQSSNLTFTRFMIV